MRRKKKKKEKEKKKKTGGGECQAGKQASEVMVMQETTM
jgi:hypothetical protein